MLKRKILFTAVYGIASALGLDLMIKNPASMLGYILFILPVALICVQWMKPYFVRKRLLNTLRSFSRETYTARFFDDRIEIETDVHDDEKTETVAVSGIGVMVLSDEEKAPEETVTVEKTVLSFTETLDSFENEAMFLLFVNRSLIYAFPKRCLSEEQTETLRTYFEDKNI